MYKLLFVFFTIQFNKINNFKNKKILLNIIIIYYYIKKKKASWRIQTYIELPVDFFKKYDTLAKLIETSINLQISNNFILNILYFIYILYWGLQITDPFSERKNKSNYNFPLLKLSKLFKFLQTLTKPSKRLVGFSRD